MVWAHAGAASYDDKGRIMVAISHNLDLGDAWEYADDAYYPRKIFRPGDSGRCKLRRLRDDALTWRSLQVAASSRCLSSNTNALSLEKSVETILDAADNECPRHMFLCQIPESFLPMV